MTSQLFRLGIALLAFTLGVGSNVATKKIRRLESAARKARATQAAPELRAQPAPLVTNAAPLPVGGDDVRRVEPESAAPDEIARVVNQGREDWEKYKVAVEVDLGSVWKQLNLEPGSFETCDAQCEASISKYELDGEPGEEILLKLTRAPRLACRYVLFKGSETVSLETEQIGHVDYDLNLYEMSTHRFVTAQDKNWLVIRGQEGSGSGFSIYGETWYEVRRATLRRVLHYPSSGQTSAGPKGLDISFDAEVLIPPRTVEGKREKRGLTIRYSVSYSTYDRVKKDSELLYENTHHARYVWNKSKREFVFAAKQSDVEEDEIFAIAGYEDPELQLDVGSYDVFLKYNRESLYGIARGADGARKEWLRDLLLEYVSDTPERKSLLTALKN
ncbi:MAG TPA: hypothetical protein VGO96_00285 [Pyrinomonadaceae bacterium]|jgi:hypothetical protein|nr:hypothetical protein [Pyrinomonadaceae bacterium]